MLENLSDHEKLRVIGKVSEDFYSGIRPENEQLLGQIFNEVKATSKNIPKKLDYKIFSSTQEVHSSEEMPYEYVTMERVFSARTFAKSAMLVLPPRPKEGFNIFVSDEFGSWQFYPLIIHRNGSKIMGVEEHMKCDVPNAVFGLKYMNAQLGWVVHQDLTFKNKG